MRKVALFHQSGNHPDPEAPLPAARRNKTLPERQSGAAAS
jgi:hypothetical protein